MATAVKQRRGTATEHDSDKGDGSGFTGLEGEITVDTTNDTIRVHDGSQVGGHRLAKYSELSTVATAITTTDESSDTTCFPLLSTDATGNLAAKTDASSLTYNASNGTLSATTFSGALDASQLTGTIADARIPSGIARDSELTSFITASSSDTLTNKSIDAGQLSGTIANARLPSAATNITSVGSLTSLTVNGTKISLTDTTTGSTTENPSLELYRNGGAGADGHELGAIKFFGNNDAGTPEKIEYAKIYSELIDASDGTEDGSLKFQLMSNGSSEDPVMTLQQFGLIMASGNSIYLGANGTLSFEGTDETNNLETAIVATNPTADRTITLPDATGSVVLNSSGVISETANLLELTSTVDDATEKPVISLYRDAGASTTNDEIGSLRFFGQNSADQKCFYAGIYTEMVNNSSGGGHKGSLRFHVADGSSGGVNISDVTADISGDEDPVVMITSSNLECKGVNLFLHDGQDIVIDGASHQTTLTHVEPTADRTVSLPNATGTVALTDTTNTAEFFEIASSTAPTSDNACHPVISIYDNADRSSQSNNPSGGLDHSGALRFYFNNKAGDKTFAAGMRAIAIDIEDGEERGGIEFCLPTGSVGDVITDVTASHSNIESPVMTLKKFGLIMATNNDIFFSQAADLLKWDTGSYNQSIRGRSSESSGANSELELPDASGTLAHIASNGGLQHPALSSNPSSPANGQTYYNTTDHKLKLYANGAWVDLN